MSASLDSTPWSACSSPKDYSNLIGDHYFYVRAVDPAGRDHPAAVREFTVDTTPPDTAIDTGPTGTINTSQASFTFGGTPAGDTAKIRCKIDAGAFADCTSPKAFTGLTDGPHTATFRAEDAAGNQDTSPSTRTFTVDTTPPDTAIDTGPSGTSSDNSPSFTFSSSEPGSSFECSFDSGNRFDCSSGTVRFTRLTDGPHTFSVTATDTAANTGPTATRSFGIDTVPPETTITSGPEGPTGNSSPSFGFSSSEPGSSFECSLNNSNRAACTSPKTYKNLSDGNYTISVRATDSVGMTDPTAAVRSFTVDTKLKASASAQKKQKQKGNNIVIKVKAKTTEDDLAAKATGKVLVGKSSFKLKPASKDISAASSSANAKASAKTVSKVLKLVPKKNKDEKKIVKALKKGKKVTAKVTVKLTDDAGNKDRDKVNVKLKK